MSKDPTNGFAVRMDNVELAVEKNASKNAELAIAVDKTADRCAELAETVKKLNARIAALEKQAPAQPAASTSDAGMSAIFCQMDIKFIGKCKAQTVADERVVIHDKKGRVGHATIQMC